MILMLVDNVTKKWDELYPYDFSFSSDCGCRTPQEMVLNWTNPVFQFFTTFQFGNGTEDFSYLCK